MPKKRFEQVVNSGDRIFDNSESTLLNSINDVEVAVFEDLIKILNTLDVSNGKLITNTKAENFLMSMDARIYSALRKANYNDSVLQFTRSFDQVADNVKQIHSVFNDINITDSQIKPFLKMEVNNTISKLTESGMAKDFINPVREALFRNIMLGEDVSTVEKTLRDFTVSSANGDSKLKRYVGQVARDSIQQFDGALQQNIQKELDLNALQYLGSLVRDSRKQCIRWVSQNQGIILLEDLAEEIRWAFNNGSGMNPATTIATFFIYRGGYRCHHRAFPTFAPPSR